MEKARLAAKFKRVSEWKDYLSGATPSESTKIKLLALLPKYEAQLKEIWNSEMIAPEQVAVLTDLERQLEDADEQARLFTAGR